jgi:elongation factor Ts
MSVSAALVMKLRERTGSGMMDCKKFLVECNGDIEAAVVAMQKAGQAKADKKADRIAAEGSVVIERSSNGKRAVILEINSETDFVARDTNFTEFTQRVAQIALESGVSDIDVLSQQNYANNLTVEQARQDLVAKIGENIKIRRMAVIESTGVVGTYLHSGRIGVLTALNADNEALAKDLAMHIAASKPLVVNRDQVPADVIAHERDIFSAQAEKSGKPAEIIKKMVEGRITKFLDEVSIEGQSFVKDPNMTVGQLLEKNHTQLSEFVRFEVGEGIEKKEDNFVEEVMAQVRD